MTSQQRPVSPHLQVYKPQLTSVLSILHRITGVIIALGALVIALWISSASYSPACYEAITESLQSLPGQILMVGWAFCTFYHLCNGIRHLFWDAGMGFDLDRTYLSGKLVVIVAILLTILVIIL